MGWIIGGILTAAILMLLLGFHRPDGKTLKWRRRPVQLVGLLGLLLILGGCIASVPTGHTGVVTTFGSVEDYTYEAGIHFKSPVQRVICMDNRTQKSDLELTAFSSDIQEVSVRFSMNYQISKENAQNIYKTIGTAYYETVVAPRIQETVKTVFAKYTAENLISSRSVLSEQITQILSDRLAEYNIVVVSTSVENIDFSDAFTDAVEAKQVAEQNKLRAQTEQQQATLEAEAAAKRTIIAAEAEAEVTKIEAEVAQYAGEKEAEKNKKLAESLTPELIEYYYTQRWNGELPEFVSGADSGTLPILKFDR